ncbi:MAG: hypothetical protein ACK5HP_03120 [Bacilli bacterium]
MKEMFRSKTMISFIIFVLGVTYFNAVQMETLETNNIENEIVMISK